MAENTKNFLQPYCAITSMQNHNSTELPLTPTKLCHIKCNHPVKMQKILISTGMTDLHKIWHADAKCVAEVHNC